MISVERFLAEHPVRLGEGEPATPADPDAPGARVSSKERGGPKRRDMKRRMPVRGGFGASRMGSSAPAAELDDPADADACREAALSLLDAAARSSGALADRLEQKGYDPDVVAATIGRLVELGLVDDLAYARQVVRSCVSRMMGARGVLQELSRKGVDRATASRVVDEARQSGAFEECAWELGRQVARRTEGMDREVRLRRFWAAGGRKGHRPDVLGVVARELF